MILVGKGFSEGRKREKDMRTLLVAALLLSLVASIYSQAVPVPTSEQLQCITDASTAQALDIANDCGSADLSNVRMYHNA